MQRGPCRSAKRFPMATANCLLCAVLVLAGALTTTASRVLSASSGIDDNASRSRMLGGLTPEAERDLIEAVPGASRGNAHVRSVHRLINAVKLSRVTKTLLGAWPYCRSW